MQKNISCEHNIITAFVIASLK